MIGIIGGSGLYDIDGIEFDFASGQVAELAAGDRLYARLSRLQFSDEAIAESAE